MWRQITEEKAKREGLLSPKNVSENKTVRVSNLFNENVMSYFLPEVYLIE